MLDALCSVVVVAAPARHRLQLRGSPLRGCRAFHRSVTIVTMASLWQSGSPTVWQEKLDGYWPAVERLGQRVLELDRWAARGRVRDAPGLSDTAITG